MKKLSMGLTVAVALSMVLWCGCPPEPPEDVWEEDTLTCDVELADGVAFVDDADAVVEVDTANHVYRFDEKMLADAGISLVEGQPLIIAGTAVRKIKHVEDEGGTLRVQTDYIPLNEAITDGTIEWDYGVEFTPDRVQAVEIPGKGLFYPKAGEPIEVSFTMGEYKYDISLTLQGETCGVDISVSKDLGATVGAKLSAKGEIKRFRSKNKVVYQGGQLKSYGNEMDGMGGEMTLELVVAASGDDFIDYKLPFPILKIPFAVGFVPIVLNLKAQFVVNASVPYDGSSSIRTKFTYDSDLGFNFNGVDVSANGRIGSLEFGKEVNQTGASSAIAANFGIGFPRLSLDIFGETLVPWAQTAFLVGGTYTFTPACQTADAQFIGALGYDLSFLGFDISSGKVTLFQEKKELLRSGNCGKSSFSPETEDTADLLMEDFYLEPSLQ